MEINEWLNQMTAAEIMVHEVVTFGVDQPLAVAADVLLREQITGAPVVDRNDACVGVLSVSDVIAAEEKVAEARKEVAESSLFHSNLSLPFSVYEDKLAEVRDRIAPAAEQPVEHFMTNDLVSVREDATLGNIVQRMVDGHIHRVVVLNENDQLQGIISTIDMLAALLRTRQTA